MQITNNETGTLHDVAVDVHILRNNHATGEMSANLVFKSAKSVSETKIKKFLADKDNALTAHDAIGIWWQTNEDDPACCEYDKIWEYPEIADWSLDRMAREIRVRILNLMESLTSKGFY